MQQFGSLAQYLLDFLFPLCCTYCKQHGYALCPSCVALIPPLQTPLCQKCCTPFMNDTFCRRCFSYPLQLNGLRIVSTYQEPLRSSIHMFKYGGNKRLGAPLGALLAQAYTTYSMQADCLIPVPLHPRREQERGYNQAQILAQTCATHLHLPVYTSLLHRVRLTRAQVHLSLQDRQHNVFDAFRCDPASATRIVANRRIIIIDDVCTTGSTLAACATPLFQAGAREVWGLVLARPL